MAPQKMSPARDYDVVIYALKSQQTVHVEAKLVSIIDAREVLVSASESFGKHLSSCYNYNYNQNM